MSTNGSRQVMDGQAIQRSVMRIAHEVVERNRGTEGLALIGIRSRGVYLAQRLRRASELADGNPRSCDELGVGFGDRAKLAQFDGAGG